MHELVLLMALSGTGYGDSCCDPCCRPRIVHSCSSCDPCSHRLFSWRRSCCHVQTTCCQTTSGSHSAAYSEAKPQKSLYERLGGEGAIKAVVDEFVVRAAGDPKVNFTRKGTDKEWNATAENVASLKKDLVNLIGALTGGPQKYTGRDMKTIHKGMKITADEFNALAADLIGALDKFKVPQKEKDELIKIVASTAGDIVEVK